MSQEKGQPTSSNTPETDAAVHHIDDVPAFQFVSYNFARKLERERDEARRLLTNVLRGDDGHDWKEAGRYIESTHPESTPDVVHGKFLPDNPNQFDYLHAIRAIASRLRNKQIFDLADTAMNLSQTNQEEKPIESTDLFGQVYAVLVEHAGARNSDTASQHQVASTGLSFSAERTKSIRGRQRKANAMKNCECCQDLEKCEMYGGCWNPPAKEKPLSPSNATACSALRYADGSFVNAGDVVKINNATCTVIRILNGNDGKPWIVACRIEGCGEIEHGVFASTFREHSPQNEPADLPPNG